MAALQKKELNIFFLDTNMVHLVCIIPVSESLEVLASLWAGGAGLLKFLQVAFWDIIMVLIFKQPQFLSLNYQDLGQEDNIEEDNNDNRDTKKPVAVSKIHPTMKILKYFMNHLKLFLHKLW